MNPYSPFNTPKAINPPIVMTLSHAQTVIKQFDTETHDKASSAQRLQHALDATVDVLLQQHPDMAEDLTLVSNLAQQVGVGTGQQFDLVAMKNQYIAALPADIHNQVVPPPA